jgi:hypothetical protein
MSLGIYNGVAFFPSPLAVAAAATIEVRRESDSGLESIFEDREGATPLTNPSAFADSSGRFQFFAAGDPQGYSVKVTSGAFTYTLRYQEVSVLGVLSAPAGSASIGYLPSGSATSRPLQDKVREVEVSITDYGATDSADIATAFAAAKSAYPNGCTIVFPETANHWLLSSQISTTDGTPYILKGRGPKSKLKKAFNGDMISLGTLSTMQDMNLDGDGGNYTGRGVIVTTGANDNVSWRRFLNCDMSEMASYCIEFTANTAGFKSQVEGGRYRTYNDAVAAFKTPDTDTNGNRTFVGVDTAESALIDLAGGQNTALIGCQGAVPDFSGGHAKTRMTGCRIHGGSAVVFDGTDLAVTGNVFGQSDVTYAVGLSRCRIGDNAFPTHTVTDNAGGFTSFNEIDYGWFTYTPVWTATGDAPAAVNGTFNGAYRREGQNMRVNIAVTFGSSDTYGTGIWGFSLPKAAARTTTGALRILDTGAGYYSGTSEVAAAASVVNLLAKDNVGNYAGPTFPITWASGDSFVLDIVYPISG